ncbi:hypothetical protein BGZ65_003631 [Modicella reniformis]|uniref:Uncharacterized protein n=1 Tax=Modicella reniformis TaxID=1440133 RepID=A0A9P6M980_9FUNG|nr:hypothetical protein BGZ65_003631 [Modicella reniformis]
MALQRNKNCKRNRTPWTTWLGLSTALFMTLPALISAAPTTGAASTAAAVAAAIARVGTVSPSTASSQLIQKRAVQYLDDSEPDMELTIEANDSYYLATIKLDECINKFPVPPTPGVAEGAFKYNALTAPSPDMVINFYTDDQCQEYEFSVVSEIHQFVGYFASAKYVGEFSGSKPGVYDKQEISKTVVPAENPDPITIVQTEEDPSGGGAGGNKTTAPSTSDEPVGITAPNPSGNGTSSAGFMVGVGIIGTITIGSIVGLSVFLYHKYEGAGKRSDGKFMTVSTGDDEDDGENGPHSSALMQSRVEASFDDERPQVDYRDRDENASDDEVELGGYSHDPSNSTQHRAEPGTHS